MARFGAIDIGTNSVLLTIVEAPKRVGSASPAFSILEEKATICRLGRGVDQTGKLGSEAQRVTLECLAEYSRLLHKHQVIRLRAAGTSALRDATNGADFLRQARDILGHNVEIASGQREAQLAFSGAVSGLTLRGPCVVFDVGGGSTEIVCGDATNRRVDVAVSLDVGSVRLHERHLRHDPPLTGELRELHADLQRALRHAPPPPAGPETESAIPAAATLVGVAGTVTTLAAMELGLEPYASDAVHGLSLAESTVNAWMQRLSESTLQQRLRFKGLEPKRADVIVAGAAIVSAVLKHYKVDRFTVSDRGVRWGLIEELSSEI